MEMRSYETVQQRIDTQLLWIFWESEISAWKKWKKGAWSWRNETRQIYFLFVWYNQQGTGSHDNVTTLPRSPLLPVPLFPFERWMDLMGRAQRVSNYTRSWRFINSQISKATTMMMILLPLFIFLSGAREENIMGKSRSFIYYPRLITMDTTAVHFSRRAAHSSSKPDGLGTWVLIIMMIYCGRKSSMSAKTRYTYEQNGLVRKNLLLSSVIHFAPG